MTPSQQCKDSGLDGLSHLVRLSKVPERTLIDWFHHRQDRFKLAIDGALFRLTEKIDEKD